MILGKTARNAAGPDADLPNSNTSRRICPFFNTWNKINKQTDRICHLYTGHSSHCRWSVVTAVPKINLKIKFLLRNNFEIPGTVRSTLSIGMLTPSRHFLCVQKLITVFVYKDIGQLKISKHCVYSYTVKVKGKFHPITGHKGPEWSRCITLLFL